MARWTIDAIPDLTGRSFLITGPGGLGYETALAIARAGGEVLLAGRDPAKGDAAVTAIRTAVAGAKLSFILLDLGSLASIREAAARLKDSRASIDVLVNNAGVMRPPTRRVTADGFELQIGTNHLGHFAWTGLLLPLLRAGQAPRVVTVASIAHRGGRIDFDDLQGERRYRAWAGYSQSKLANLLFARELDRRSREQGWSVASIAAHPGVSRTSLVANGQRAVGRSTDGVSVRLMEAAMAFIAQSAARGALPQLYAATDPGAQAGGYYGPDGISEMKGWPAPARRTRAAEDDEAARRLWTLSEALTGVTFG